ncbi:MAG: undecaprenyl-diphosphate phosphatase [Chloroflexota bacterium]
MLDLIKVILLGIVEGVTEFLPISSTGHLIVAVALLKPNFSAALAGTFEIFIQLGAVLAVVAFYRADLWQQVKTVRTDKRTQHFWVALVIACIPAALLAFALRNFIKTTLFSPIVVAISLIVGGVAILLLERMLAKRRQADITASDALMDVSYRQALVIGLIQGISLIPGVSRAAASIFGGMLMGLNRETATRFSFYLAIPTLGGATILDLLLSLDEIQSSDLIYLAVGALVSAVVAWVVVGWLLRYISRHDFTTFGYYRIAAGVVILLLAALALL